MLRRMPFVGGGTLWPSLGNVFSLIWVAVGPPWAVERVVLPAQGQSAWPAPMEPPLRLRGRS